RLAATGITRQDLLHTVHMLKHGLNPPEAPSCKNRSLHWPRGSRIVERGSIDHHRFLGEDRVGASPTQAQCNGKQRAAANSTPSSGHTKPPYGNRNGILCAFDPEFPF